MMQARVQELEHAVLLRTSALEQAKQHLSAKGLAEAPTQPDREDSNDSDQVSSGSVQLPPILLRIHYCSIFLLVHVAAATCCN